MSSLWYFKCPWWKIIFSWLLCDEVELVNFLVPVTALFTETLAWPRELGKKFLGSEFICDQNQIIYREKKKNIFTRRNVFPGSFHSFILQCQCYCPRDLYCVRRYYIFNKDWHLTCSRRSGDSLNVASNISSSCAGVTFLQQKNLK